MDVIGSRIAGQYPDSNKSWGVNVEPYIDQVVKPELRRSLWVPPRGGGSRAADRMRQSRQSDPGAEYEARTGDRYSFSIGSGVLSFRLDPAVAHAESNPWSPESSVAVARASR